MRKNTKGKTLAIVATAVVLMGCANATKEQMGTAIGALAGAVIGKQVGGDKGMVLGAVAGGVLGNRIGAHMDEQDRKTLAALEQKALDTGTGGTFVTNKSKAKVTVEASPVTLDRRQPFVLSSTATPYPLTVIDPKTVTAYVDTPIYNAISEKDRPKMVIQKGVPMRVTANVANENWVVVGDGNLGLGYVPRRYLDAGIVTQVKTAETKAPVKTTQPKAGANQELAQGTQVIAAKAVADGPPRTVSKEQYEQEMSALHNAYKPRIGSQSTTSASTLSAPQSTIQVVQASTECKVVSRKVEAADRSAPFIENVKYCKEPPKGWQTQTA